MYLHFTSPAGSSKIHNMTKMMDKSLMKGPNAMTRKKDGFQSEMLLVLQEQFVRDYAEHPLAGGLFVTDIGYFPHARHHYRERKEGCEAYILIFCSGGEGWVRIEDHPPQMVKKYDLLVIPANVPHAYGASDTLPWSIYWFHFRGDQAQHYIDLLPLSRSLLRLDAQDALRLTEWFQACYTLLSEKGYSLPHCLHANQFMGQILGMLALQRPSEADQLSNGYVEQSIRYMKQSIAENLSLAQLSEQANLSRSHYLSVFKSVTGQSPAHYFQQLKIQQACTYLDLTDWSIKEISGRVGFKDPLYFSRAFRKSIGVSPSTYREKMKG
ncbi:transcriptional regulator, AraC family [Paenibacillus mucilaginosus KNP414]|uniref:Transcriptional regulator, AraC family n=2 Tax=Paenibacillus mucilaginosus TaxID=61624 RepID=F8FD53_PAEMK|nr:transcriptional regulator, AraC family [Paenibacillus mucilaginosus KNP414]